MKIDTKRYILEALAIALVLTGGITWATQTYTDAVFNTAEVLSVFFSFACTWLCTRQVRFNYVFGVVSTALLSYTFWKAGLYGSMALNLYLIPTVIYGWFVWGRDVAPKRVEHVKPKSLLAYAFFTTITWYGAVTIIEAAGGEVAALDSWLLVGSILAQFMLDRKKMENWLVWMAVNVVSIYVYFEAGLYILAVQFAFFLANAIFAWFQWRASMKVTSTEAIVPPVGPAAIPVAEVA